MSSPPDHTNDAPRLVNAGELLRRAAARIDRVRSFVSDGAAVSYSALTSTPDGRNWRVTVEPIAP